MREFYLRSKNRTPGPEGMMPQIARSLGLNYKNYKAMVTNIIERGPCLNSEDVFRRAGEKLSLRTINLIKSLGEFMGEQGEDDELCRRITENDSWPYFHIGATEYMLRFKSERLQD
jgi:hypothetical protein